MKCVGFEVVEKSGAPFLAYEVFDGFLCGRFFVMIFVWLVVSPVLHGFMDELSGVFVVMFRLEVCVVQFIELIISGSSAFTTVGCAGKFVELGFECFGRYIQCVVLFGSGQELFPDLRVDVFVDVG